MDADIPGTVTVFRVVRVDQEVGRLEQQAIFRRGVFRQFGQFQSDLSHSEESGGGA